MSKKPLQPVQVLGMTGTPPHGRGGPPIRLDTVHGCLEELAAVYRAAKHGRMDVNRARSMTYMLQVILRGHETAALEARINALETTHADAS